MAAQIEQEGGEVRMGLGEALGRHAQVLPRTEESVEEDDGALLLRAITGSLWSFLGNFTAHYPLVMEDASSFTMRRKETCWSVPYPRTSGDTVSAVRCVHHRCHT